MCDFNLLASEYDAWFDGDGKPIFGIEVNAFQEILPLLPRPWLEIGVGSGRFAHSLGIDTGIDPSIRLVQMAAGRGGSVTLALGEELPFQKESFGTVFLIVTLCFVKSPSAVRLEARRVLTAGGKAVLGLVLSGSPWGQFYEAEKQRGHRFYAHATFYGYEEVRHLLVHAGFTVELVLSSLFQRPGDVVEPEAPREGFSPDAGFTILVAAKGTGGEPRN